MSKDLFKDGKIEGTEATFHSIREYFRAYVVKEYTFDEIIKTLDELETGFLKTLEKK